MNYSHVVYVKTDGEKHKLCVDRMFADGKRDFAMEFEIPTGSLSEDELWDQFEHLATDFGKFLCIDSPDLRKIMGIEE